MKIKILTITIASLALVGCATNVGVATTHREDLAAPSGALAIATSNLEGSVRGKQMPPGAEEAAESVAKLNEEAQHFARATKSWTSNETVNDRYEGLIRAWVKVKQSFPSLHPDPLTQESYNRVAQHYEKVARASGYANVAYERELEK